MNIYNYSNIVKYTIGLPLLIVIVGSVYLFKVFLVYICIGLFGFIFLSTLHILDDGWARLFHDSDRGINEFMIELLKPNRGGDNEEA